MNQLKLTKIQQAIETQFSALKTRDEKKFGGIQETCIREIYRVWILKQGNVCIDIGAHKGLHTFAMADSVGTKGLVFSYEANKFLASSLKESCIEQNRRHINVYNYAVSNKHGETITFYNNTSYPGQSTIVQGYGKNFSTADAMEVTSVTLDEHLLPQIDKRVLRFIKIDAEGAEIDILKGAIKLLSKYKPLVGLELSIYHVKQHEREFFEVLDSCGYQCYTLSGIPVTSETLKMGLKSDCYTVLICSKKHWISDFCANPQKMARLICRVLNVEFTPDEDQTEKTTQDGFKYFTRKEDIVPKPILISDFENVLVPSSVPEVPGMISPQECRYLYHLASELYTGRGKIVEVGTWLGKSTSHIVAGVQHKHPNQKLHCYDNYIWIDFYNSHHSKTVSGTPFLNPGEDFLPLFKQYQLQYLDWLEVVKCDMGDIKWTGGPIEVLILDAPKRFEELHRCLKIFLPHLMDNSIIVFQDFFHSPSYSIPFTLGVLKPHITLDTVVINSSMAVFKRTSSFSSLMLDFAIHNFKEKPHDQEMVWAKIFSGMPEVLMGVLAVSKAMMHEDLGMLDEIYSTFAMIRLSTFAKKRAKFLSSVVSYKRKYPYVFQALAEFGQI